MSCPPFVAGASTTCTASVTGAIAGGTFTFTTTSLSGSFVGSPCTANPLSCSVTYTDTSPGSPTITAQYSSGGSPQGTTVVSISGTTTTIPNSITSLTTSIGTSHIGCPFSINFTQDYSVYTNTSDVILNVTVKKLKSNCVISSTKGALRIFSGNSGAVSYLINVSTGGIITSVSKNIKINANLLPHGADTAKLTLASTDFTNSSLSHFLIIGPADIAITNLTVIPNIVSIEEPLFLFSNISNQAFFGATNVVANVRIKFPDASLYKASFKLNPISALSSLSTIVDPGEVSTEPGVYKVFENISYSGDYDYNGVNYVFPYLISNEFNSSYIVTEQKFIPYRINYTDAKTPIFGAGPLKFDELPFSSEIHSNKPHIFYLGMLNTANFSIYSNISFPKNISFGKLTSSGDFVQIKPGQSIFVEFNFTSYPNATPSLYQVPINISSQSASGNFSLQTKIYPIFCIMSMSNILHVAKDVTINGTNRSASVSFKVSNMANESANFIKLTQKINTTLSNTIYNISAPDATVAKSADQYVLNWSISPLQPGESVVESYVIYNISSSRNLLSILPDNIELSFSQEPAQINFSIINITLPNAAELNSAFSLNITSIFSGASASKLTFNLMVPNGFLVQNPQQAFYVNPETVLTPSFSLKSKSAIGLQTINLIITGPFNTISIPLTINVTAQQTPLQSVQSQLETPIITFISILSIIILAYGAIKIYELLKRKAAKTAIIKSIDDLTKLKKDTFSATLKSKNKLRVFYRHKNQDGKYGGFVETSAKISPTAFVESTALILDYSTVSDNAKVQDYAVVSENATVRDNAIVSNNATVYGHAIIAGDATVYGAAKVHGNAKVQDYAEVFGDSTVYEKACIFGAAKICGKAKIHGKANVFGRAIVSAKNLRKGDTK